MTSIVFRRFLSTARNVLTLNESKWSPEVLEAAKQSCSVSENFITEDEEKSLLDELEPHMKRLKYEKAHWDDAIYLYREREQRNWSPKNSAIIQRVMEKSFPKEITRRSAYIHILDLHADGHIKPHIDATRYCGRVVTGLSLMSDCIMRLRHKDHKQDWIIDLLLPKRSLYKISDTTRYDFTHEILDAKESVFDGRTIKKQRRISLICRDLPEQKSDQELSFKTLE